MIPLIAALLLLCCLSSAAGETFFFISDTHMKSTGESLSASAAALAAVTAHARGSDTLLLLGDTTDNGLPEEHALACERAETLARDTGARVLLIPGNHDYNARFGPEAYAAQYAAFEIADAFSRDSASASCAVRTPGGTVLLLLDSNLFDARDSGHVLPNGGFTAETLAWAEGVLAGLPRSEKTPVIVCGHHTILPRSRDERTPGAAVLADLLRRHGVTLYLCGHDHGFATVEEDGLRQITVGQPQAYPGWAGVLTVEAGAMAWRTEAIYDAEDPVFRLMRASTETLAASMATGTLAPTIHAGDEEAIAWYVRVFMRHASGEITPEFCAEMLADDQPGCRKWREIETRTVVKDWIFSLLEHCPESVGEIEVAGRK